MALQCLRRTRGGLISGRFGKFDQNKKKSRYVKIYLHVPIFFRIFAANFTTSRIMDKPKWLQWLLNFLLYIAVIIGIIIFVVIMTIIISCYKRTITLLTDINDLPAAIIISILGAIGIVGINLLVIYLITHKKKE